MIVVTAGSAYLDIDAYAGCIAYAELLRRTGREAVALSTSPLNSSVTDGVLDPDVDIRSYVPGPKDMFVMIDVSNRDYLDTHVREQDVIEVIDHHPGHEAFWREKLHSKAQIEPIGAACTLVYERWKQADMLADMRPQTARMLAAGILDNTLNFTAAITSERDHEAYAQLTQLERLPDTFAADYFSEVQQAIEQDLENAIRNDMKRITETDALPKALGQLVVWDAEALLETKKHVIDTVMASYDDDWAVNVVDVSRGKTYFVAVNQKSQAKLTNLFSVVFDDGIAAPRPALLRKEIIKTALQ